MGAAGSSGEGLVPYSALLRVCVCGGGLGGEDAGHECAQLGWPFAKKEAQLNFPKCRMLGSEGSHLKQGM